MAFEAFLDRRGTPYVAVDDVRHFTRKDTGVKAFDYLVYPAGSPACLVDVKGRKSIGRGVTAECREKNWVTRSDVTGLLTWQEVFGSEFTAAFVFAYWIAGNGLSSSPRAEAVGGTAAHFGFAGRRYGFWLVSVAEYARYVKDLSKRWDTVSIPRERFREISRKLELCWPSAPC